MKKTLALILAIVMALGCMSVTVFAERININEVKVTVSNYNPTDYSIDVSVPGEAVYSINSVSIVFCEGDKGQLIYNVNGQHWSGLNDFYGYEGDVAPDFSGHSFNTFALIHISLPIVFPPVPGQDEYMFDTINTLAYVNDTAMTKVNSEVFEDGKYTVDYRDVRIYIDPDQYTAPAGKSGDTDITLTVAKSLTYDMVIPEAVSIDAAGVHSVGQAKVENVKNATDNTVISYTAATTAFKCEGKTAIPASYYTDEAGQNAFPTTAVEVYKNKKDAENIPTMYVGISETAWNAAENGTYTATATFNFEAIEDEYTVADAVATVSDHLRIIYCDGPVGFDNGGPEWTNENGFRLFEVVNGRGEGTTDLQFAANVGDDSFYLSVDTVLTKSGNAYTCTEGDVTYTFAFAENTLASVTVSGSSFTTANGVYNRPVLVNDILTSVAIPTCESLDALPSGAWVNQANTDAKMFVYDGLCFFAPGARRSCGVPLSAVLTISGENYICSYYGETVTFNMSGNVLQSVTLASDDDRFNMMYGNALGTYTAPAAN